MEKIKIQSILKFLFAVWGRKQWNDHVRLQLLSWKDSWYSRKFWLYCEEYKMLFNTVGLYLNQWILYWFYFNFFVFSGRRNKGWWGTYIHHINFSSYQCSSVNGKHYRTIKFLRKTSGATIIMAKKMLPNSNDNAVFISGTSDNISKAIREICNVLKTVNIFSINDVRRSVLILFFLFNSSLEGFVLKIGTVSISHMTVCYLL